MIPKLRQSFGQGLCWLLDRHAPFKQRKNKNIYAPWITPQFTRKRRTRDIRKQKAVTMKSKILMQANKEIRNQVNSDNFSLKREYFKNETTQQKGNVKGTSSVINKLINRRSKTQQFFSLTLKIKSVQNLLKKSKLSMIFYRNRGISK